MLQITIESQIKPFIFLVLVINLLSLNIIFAKTNESIGSKREVRSFRGMLISYMVYALVDLRLLMGDAFYTAFPRLFVMLVISVGFSTMSFSCFFWFLHVRASLQFSSKSKAVMVWNIINHVPLLIVLIILFSPLHVFAYVLEGGVAVFRPGISFILLMDYIYLIAATGISIYKRRRARTKSEKKKYNSQIIFILFFTINGLLIGFLINLPAIELCVIPVVLKLFVELQDSQIYTDALTKLYNRRRMTEFVNEEIATCSEENPLNIIMVDLDYFKSINDILGHDEGDKALIAFSRALRNIVNTRNAVAARWGGDEFVIAGKDKDLNEQIRDLIQEELEGNNTLQYTPRFSIGLYRCTNQAMNCEQALIEADNVLYADKNKRHLESNNFVDELNRIKMRN